MNGRFGSHHRISSEKEFTEMIVGDPSRFALESEITYAYDLLSQRGLGYFVIHVGGQMLRYSSMGCHDVGECV